MSFLKDFCFFFINQAMLHRGQDPVFCKTRPIEIEIFLYYLHPLISYSVLRATVSTLFKILGGFALLTYLKVFDKVSGDSTSLKSHSALT